MIASIEGQAVVDKVLQNLQAKGTLQPPLRIATGRRGLAGIELVCLAPGFRSSLRGMVKKIYQSCGDLTAKALSAV